MANKKQRTSRIPVEVDPKDKNAIQTKAKEEGRTVSGIVRVFLFAYKRNDPRVKSILNDPNPPDQKA